MDMTREKRTASACFLSMATTTSDIRIECYTAFRSPARVCWGTGDRTTWKVTLRSEGAQQAESEGAHPSYPGSRLQAHSWAEKLCPAPCFEFPHETTRTVSLLYVILRSKPASHATTWS